MIRGPIAESNCKRITFSPRGYVFSASARYFVGSAIADRLRSVGRNRRRVAGAEAQRMPRSPSRRHRGIRCASAPATPPFPRTKPIRSQVELHQRIYSFPRGTWERVVVMAEAKTLKGSAERIPRTKPIRSQVEPHQRIYSFPRGAWECRPGRSRVRIGGPRKTTRSVEDGIPTEDRGNESSSWRRQKP